MPSDASSDGLVTRIFDGWVRFSGDRTVAGVVVPFDCRTDLLDTSETMAPGSFARSVAERGPGRVKVLLHDNRGAPIGKVTDLREESEGLFAEIAFADTRDADEALDLFHANEAAVAVSFLPVAHRLRADVVEHTEVALRRLLVIRSAPPDERSAHADFVDPSIDLARRRLALASLKFGEPQHV